MTTHQEAAEQHHAEVRARELRLFGASINPCQSIPPRHAPYIASDGHTYCTRCGDDITPAPEDCDGDCLGCDDLDACRQEAHGQS